jgi:hypothetical protein
MMMEIWKTDLGMSAPNLLRIDYLILQKSYLDGPNLEMKECGMCDHPQWLVESE